VHHFGVRLVPFIPITHNVCMACALTLFVPRHFEGPMSVYLGRLYASLHDFNELLPPFANVKKELENCIAFFMTLGLYLVT